MIRSLLAAIVIYTLTFERASAVITLDASYDSAALKSYTVTGDTINLVGRDNY